MWSRTVRASDWYEGDEALSQVSHKVSRNLGLWF